ncbi:hypothetical protein IT575_10655 [bacterium]|nr:hypothetical protein [bacterium]
MANLPVENFLSTPPCPFRRVSFGCAHCTVSTDSHISEVDPLTCMNCEVPKIIAEPRCRHLSLGTELKPYRGEGRLVTAMACRALNIKLYSLKTCEECPLYSEVDSLAEVMRVKAELAEIQLPMRESLIEEIARDIRLEYGVRESEAPEPQPIRCWRFPEGRCRKFPVYTRGKVTVVLKNNERNNELYTRAILPALKEMHLTAYRIDEEQAGEEEMCRSCENVQESDYAIINLDDWDTNTLFLTGIIYGIGRRIAMLKNMALTEVPLPGRLEHDLVRYESVDQLKDRLMDHFRPYVKPGATDGPLGREGSEG